jgi:hypothetical protein
MLQGQIATWYTISPMGYSTIKRVSCTRLCHQRKGKVIDMTKQQAIQLFEQKQVRTVWDEEQENGIFQLWMWWQS